jgi:RRXRR protein
MFVPVVDREQRPLMPTTPARARRWIKTAKATAFWKGGLFCVRLNIEPSAREHQRIAVGIDPGSKKEALVVASAAHTYLNIQADARTGVKEAKKQCTRMRRTRRGRNTPCRKPRQNRKHSKKKVPPSTKARWHRDFSPLQVGKYWFYKELGKLAPVRSMQGFQTKELRVELGLKKTSNKMAEVWQAHCVDAWVLAHATIGGCKAPDNTRLVCIAPLIWHRRQLHKLQPAKGGTRRREGGTLSLGIKRGTLVNHPTWGKAYVGGTMNGKLSLHALRPGKRITQSANVPDCTLIKLLRWRTRIVPYTKVPVSSAQKERTPVISPVGTGHPQAHIGEIHGDARP